MIENRQPASGGGRRRLTLIAAMKEIQVDGITGSMTWDESGAVTKTPMAATIENGVYVFK